MTNEGLGAMVNAVALLLGYSVLGIVMLAGTAAVSRWAWREMAVLVRARRLRSKQPETGYEAGT